MGARQKLNSAYVNGSLLLAAFVGWLAGSWAVFFVALAALLACNVWRRAIRSDRRGRHRREGS